MEVWGWIMESRKLFNLIKKREKKCWICQSSQKLNVHHIDFNHENNDCMNLLVLCQRCHSKLHFLFQLMGLQERGFTLNDPKLRKRWEW